METELRRPECAPRPVPVFQSVVDASRAAVDAPREDREGPTDGLYAGARIAGVGQVVAAAVTPPPRRHDGRRSVRCAQ